MHVAEPFKKANKMFHPQPTVIDVNGTKVGGKKLALMAGPCSVENEAQIVEVAKAVKKSGANFLRGGAFKPRTSPYAFQGLKYQGLELLKEAREVTGLPIVTEIMSPFDIDIFVRDVDVIQVGARNMQNFDLLRLLGQTRKPILLKRGLSATIEEWLMSAEYIMAGGNEQIILCERGIRTFETYTRNTLDLSAIVAVKQLHSRGSFSRYGQMVDGRASCESGCCSRCGRTYHRGSQRSRSRALRRQPVYQTGRFRRSRRTNKTNSIRSGQRGLKCVNFTSISAKTATI